MDLNMINLYRDNTNGTSNIMNQHADHNVFYSPVSSVSLLSTYSPSYSNHAANSVIESSSKHNHDGGPHKHVKASLDLDQNSDYHHHSHVRSSISSALIDSHQFTNLSSRNDYRHSVGYIGASLTDSDFLRLNRQQALPTNLGPVSSPYANANLLGVSQNSGLKKNMNSNLAGTSFSNAFKIPKEENDLNVQLSGNYYNITNQTNYLLKEISSKEGPECLESSLKSSCPNENIKDVASLNFSSEKNLAGNSDGLSKLVSCESAQQKSHEMILEKMSKDEAKMESPRDVMMVQIDYHFKEKPGTAKRLVKKGNRPKQNNPNDDDATSLGSVSNEMEVSNPSVFINGVNSATCPHCFKFYKTSEKLHKHIEKSCIGNRVTVKTINSMNNEQYRSGNEKSHECEKCKKKFASLGSLHSHMKTHSKIKSFHCTACDKSFAQKSTLDTHMFRHLGIKPYQCMHCNMTFRHQTSLNQHNLKHLGIKPFKCLQCADAFRQQSNLTAHVKRYHSM